MSRAFVTGAEAPPAAERAQDVDPRAVRRAAAFDRPQPVLAARATGGPIRLYAPRQSDIGGIVAFCIDPADRPRAAA